MATGDFLISQSGSAQKFNQAAAGGDLALSFAPAGTGVANGAGRICARWDRGSSALVEEYNYLFRCRAQTNPTVGNQVRLYLLATDDDNYRPGDLGTADAAISTENDLLNAYLFDTVVADAASTTRNFNREGSLFLRARYISIAYWNAMGVSMSNTSTNGEFVLWPRNSQYQP